MISLTFSTKLKSNPNRYKFRNKTNQHLRRQNFRDHNHYSINQSFQQVYQHDTILVRTRERLHVRSRHSCRRDCTLEKVPVRRVGNDMRVLDSEVIHYLYWILRRLCLCLVGMVLSEIGDWGGRRAVVNKRWIIKVDAVHIALRSRVI